jgi:hypothetical protein
MTPDDGPRPRDHADVSQRLTAAARVLGPAGTSNPPSNAVNATPTTTSSTAYLHVRRIPGLMDVTVRLSSLVAAGALVLLIAVPI